MSFDPAALYDRCAQPLQALVLDVDSLLESARTGPPRRMPGDAQEDVEALLRMREAVARLAKELRVLRSGNEASPGPALSVGCDEHDGLLSERLGDRPGEATGAAGDGATPLGGVRSVDDLDHDRVLGASLPGAASAEKGHVLERGVHERLETLPEGLGLERGGESRVPSLRSVRRDAGADVEPDDARGLVSACSPLALGPGETEATGSSAAHGPMLPPAGVTVSLPFRGPSATLSGRYAIAFTPLKEGGLVGSLGGGGLIEIRTSWLPHDPGAASEGLRDLGFACEQGSFVARVSAADEIAIRRMVRAVVRALLKEG